ncbi:MAG: WG repeat-containing protein [Bacteroidetes bacterium]|nr:WG repeat-containing protein [Bacteroidota bacterium]
MIWNIRILACLWLLAGLAGCSSSDNPQETGAASAGWLYPFVKEGKWGYRDAAGVVRLQHTLSVDWCEIIRPEHSQLAPFCRNNLYGYVHADKGIVVPARYLAAGPFREGRAPAQDTSGLWGYLNEQGEWVIRPTYDWAGVFGGGAATVLQNGRYHILLAGGQAILLPYVRVFDFYEGLAIVESAQGYGFVNARGREVVPPRYLGATGFGHARAFLQRPGGGWVLIDTSGKITSEASYEAVYGFTEGRAAVRMRGTWGYIGADAQAVLEFKYEEAYPFENGIALVKERDQFAWIRSEGEYAFDKKQPVPFPFSQGLAVAEEKGLAGYLRPNGGWQIPAQFTNAQPFSEGLAAVEQDGKVGFVDTEGRFIIQPQYESAQPFSEGLAAVRNGGQWGYIDRKGEWVIRPAFGGAFDFQEGLGAVAEGELIGFVNRKGEWVFRPQFRELPLFQCGSAVGHLADGRRLLLTPQGSATPF